MPTDDDFRVAQGPYQTVPLSELRSAETSLAQPTEPPDGTRFDSVGHFGIERRKFRRLALDELGVLAHEGRHEGPCDISRGGAGLIVAAQPALGARVTVVLPADDGDPEGLALEGPVVRAVSIVEPVERGGSQLPTFHCFTCGWTGFFDPITRELATTVRRHADSTFGGQSRIGGDRSVPGQPAACLICGMADPVAVDRALYRVGVRLDRLGLRDAERLAQYVERAVLRKEGLGRRQHRRLLADYVPMRVDCGFQTPRELATAYLRDISQGGIGFASVDELALGTEVRIALRPGNAPEGFVLPATIIARQAHGSGYRYGARFERFEERVRQELRRFIEEITDRAVQRTERAEERRSATLRLGRELWLGLALGLLVAAAGAVLLALRS